MRLRHAFAIVPALVLGLAAASGAAAAQPGLTTVRHAPSGFSIQAPAGTTLRVSKGVYVLKHGGSTLTFSRSLTNVTPEQFGTALLGQLGGTVRARQTDGRSFAAQIAVPGRIESFAIVRHGAQLDVTTSSDRSAPISLALLRQIGGSARGGYALRAPAQSAAATVPLTQYRAPDGGATALVPSGWSNIQSSGGAIQGVGPNNSGVFLFGYSINIFMPGSAPGGTAALISPYLNAATALTQFWPRLTDGVTDIRITKVIRDASLPSFTSSGTLQIAYRYKGRPWVGMVTIGTDGPEKYSNFIWNLYYSGIGVPAGSDGSVGAALLKVWRSGNPSGAIAARTQAALQLQNDTNALAQQTSEFRSRIADQQSRDVGCLLQGWSVIEDNARKYSLPPLPCGQGYVRTS
jgi:hypothetical protein